MKPMKPMKYSLILALNLALLLVAGCSSTPTKVNTGQIRAASFNFIAVRPAPTAWALPDGDAPIHAMIQDSITRNLAAKGLSKVASGGDVTLAYLVITGNNRPKV